MTLRNGGGGRRRGLTDEVVSEMSVWSPAERMRMFRRWHRGSLSIVHLNVLSILELEGPLAMGRLADALDVSVASATGIIDRMEGRGLVERKPQAADRRVIEVHITDGGAAVFPMIADVRTTHLEQVLDQLSARELGSLLIGLRALRRAREALDAEAVAASPPTAPATAP